MHNSIEYYKAIDVTKGNKQRLSISLIGNPKWLTFICFTLIQNIITNG